MLAASILLLRLSVGVERSQLNFRKSWGTPLGALGAVIFAATGLLTLLLGGQFLAFGLFVSGLTRDQIVAFVLAALIGALFVLSGQDKLVEVLDGLVPDWAVGTFLYESLSVMPHFEAFTDGVVGLGHVAYFGSMIVFFVFMNLVTLRKVGGEFGD